MTTRQEATAKGDTVVEMSRVYDAPRQAVFTAWTNPQQWAKWFAPEPLTVPQAETDPRPGGRYTFVMRDEEGNDYKSVGVYREVVEPERLVYTDSSDEMQQQFVDTVNEMRGAPNGSKIPDGIATVTFEDLGGGKTKMTFHEEFDSKETRDAWVEMQMIEGLDAGFDTLEKMLATTGAAIR